MEATYNFVLGPPHFSGAAVQRINEARQRYCFCLDGPPCTAREWMTACSAASPAVVN
ncbi:hypothetical protein P153DRAFT_368982 [Dothidotthia symphoricarpi CBS 119687]|uniref:Uncharacterized protein n=1 Tax=Dothidotthia symphoricarpi CBS 119687 TaxID=1392245 RepID=A0A6A6A4N6_9PLEO|nr:uncharacterized protein P153DRAFT_368982 [Dothidotthia symphoricarpi CBS 119687]KAF2126962.1 hypothetical protein P153DRAFT_368982 [Dothidotthia symphoricarpi CBS 119687]